MNMFLIAFKLFLYSFHICVITEYFSSFLMHAIFSTSFFQLLFCKILCLGSLIISSFHLWRGLISIPFVLFRKQISKETAIIKESTCPREANLWLFLGGGFRQEFYILSSFSWEMRIVTNMLLNPCWFITIHLLSSIKFIKFKAEKIAFLPQYISMEVAVSHSVRINGFLIGIWQLLSGDLKSFPHKWVHLWKTGVCKM